MQGPETAVTRYRPIWAPNGVAVASSALAAQAAVDVLQNGATAVDACVAALGIGLRQPGSGLDFPLDLTALIESDGFTSPFIVAQTFEDMRSLLGGLHQVVRDFGVRSLYDLLRFADYGDRNGLERRAGPELAALAEQLEVSGAFIFAPLAPMKAETLSLGEWAFIATPGLIGTEFEDAFRQMTSSEGTKERPRVENLADAMTQLAASQESVPAVSRETQPYLATAIDHRGMVASFGVSGVASYLKPLQMHLEREGKSRLALNGFPLSAVGQTLFRWMTGMGPQEAVEAPRMHSAAGHSRIYEAQMEQETLEAAAAGGRPLEADERFSGRAGTVLAIEADHERGILVAAADPRSECQAAGY